MVPLPSLDLEPIRLQDAGGIDRSKAETLVPRDPFEQPVGRSHERVVFRPSPFRRHDTEPTVPPEDALEFPDTCRYLVVRKQFGRVLDKTTSATFARNGIDRASPRQISMCVFAPPRTARRRGRPATIAAASNPTTSPSGPTRSASATTPCPGPHPAATAWSPRSIASTSKARCRVPACNGVTSQSYSAGTRSYVSTTVSLDASGSGRVVLYWRRSADFRNAPPSGGRVIPPASAPRPGRRASTGDCSTRRHHRTESRSRSPGDVFGRSIRSNVFERRDTASSTRLARGE